MLRMHMLSPFRQRERQQRAARVLSAIAGAACGHSRSRRGSAIVLSVSALVLLSVLTLVYWGLGRSDAHTAITLRRKTDVNTTVDQFKDYLASVIARDKTAWYAELGGTGITKPPVVYREAWDFPWVDSTRRSIPDVAKPSAFDRTRFDPAGTMPQSWDPVQTGLNIEAFDGSDPFLASPQPIFLGMLPEMTGPDWMIGARDWWNISNFAPDGRFVNLYNLRNNFEAPSGFTNKRQSNAGTQNSPPQAISDYLSLFRVNGTAWTTKDDGSRATPNIPADWSMRQRSAFRPTVEVRYDINDPRNAFYQWADTDGDGFFDARWFELVDASANNRLISLLPQDDSFRWFFAARAVDLTGLVNVNTATDLRGGDTASSSQGDDEFRIGTTPADIDFLRIMMMADTSRQNFIDPNTQGGYVQLLQGDPATGTTPIPADYTGYTMAEAANVAVKADEARSAFFSLRAVPPYTPPPPPFTLSAQDRYEQYKIDATGVIPGEAIVDVTGIGSWQTTSVPLFGMPSLYELLTYRGTNDDANTSPLERVLGGRYDIGYFSPLRDNRPLFLEKLHAELAITNTANPGQAAFESMVWSAMDVRQLMTTISGADEIRSSRLRFDPTIDPVTKAPRSFLESVSQIGGTWNLDPANPVANFEGRFNAVDALERASLSSDRASPGGLFRAYAKALLPHAGELGISTDWANPQQRTLFYGHNPYLALVTAAHMTANAIDMYDDDTRRAPSAFTLLIDENARTSIAPATIKYPYWQTPSGRLDLGAELLPTNVPNTLTGAPEAVNIFGIEAQPFLIDASMFIMYTDTPFSSATPGDDDGGFSRGGPPPIITPDEITIDGTIDQSNPDFITQLLVFQLTNPFSKDLELWGSDSQFYVEFADHFYPLGSIDRSLNDLVDLSSSEVSNVTLQAGETKVFYASTFNLDDVDNRLANVNTTRTIAQWVDVQFDTDAVYIGKVGKSDLPRLDLLAPGNDDQNRVLALWRVMGDIANIDDDLMADRLRDPGGGSEGSATLDRRMEENLTGTGLSGALLKGTRIVGAFGFQELDPQAGSPGDRNTGMSIVLSGSIHRPRGETITAPSLGEFPAWCIERKYDTTSLNVSNTIGGDPIALRVGDFDDVSPLGTALAGDQTMDDMLSQQASNVLFGMLTQEPWWDSNTDIGTNLLNQGYAQAKAEIHLDDNRFVGGQNAGNVPIGTNLEGRALRVADMLLPMGVGPAMMPNESQGLTLAEDFRWTTLSEAMALSLGYDSVAPATSGEKLHENLHLLFDKGQLRLDTRNQVIPNAYVPFVDLNTNGVWDSGEPTRGAGVPIAYNVLDVFTTTDATFGSMRRPRLGVINANTAPLSVLRTIPLLTPPSSADGSPGRWWWSGAPDAPTDQTDVAASVFGYIHKGVVPSISTVVNTVDFSAGGLFGDPDPANTARAATTKIDGIRETPGMRSLGELMAVRGGAGTDTSQDMDYMGSDALNIEMKGVESILYKNRTDFDDIPDDYDEKLAAINAVLGTTSVRSDYFAVWFVVHGYQRDDVEGLRPQDPLTPTVSKRFVMVVDRTNVQRLGDKPRILLFQEVPM
jgi:hypothetical protein